MVQEQKIKKAKQKKSEKESLHDHARKYNVLIELANASPELHCGQIVRGDANDENKEIHRLISRKSNFRRPIVRTVSKQPRRLNAVPVMIHETKAEALLDYEAVPNHISSKLCDGLALDPKPTTRKTNVASGQSAVCKRILYDISISFRDVSVSLEFHVIDGLHLDIIVVYTTTESLQTIFDIWTQHMKMKIDTKRVKPAFDYACVERSDEEGFQTDSYVFTSHFDAGIRSHTASEDEEPLVVALRQKNSSETP